MRMHLDQECAHELYFEFELTVLLKGMEDIDDRSWLKSFFSPMWRHSFILVETLSSCLIWKRQKDKEGLKACIF